MPDVREKLVELLGNLFCGDYGIDGCDSCKYNTEVMCSAYACADHLIANGVTIQRWIPVTERLPEIVKTTHAWRNVYRKSDRVLCLCLQKDGKRFVKEGYMEFFNDYPQPSWIIPGTIDSVTNWMPLPEAPKGE